MRVKTDKQKLTKHIFNILFTISFIYLIFVLSIYYYASHHEYNKKADDLELLLIYLTTILSLIIEIPICSYLYWKAKLKNISLFVLLIQPIIINIIFVFIIIITILLVIAQGDDKGIFFLILSMLIIETARNCLRLLICMTVRAIMDTLENRNNKRNRKQ